MVVRLVPDSALPSSACGDATTTTSSPISEHLRTCMPDLLPLRQRLKLQATTIAESVPLPLQREHGPLP